MKLTQIERLTVMKEFKTMEDVAEFLGVGADTLVGGVDLPTGSQLLGIGISTLRARALGGKIGYSRDGRRWIFSWQDIADYITDRHRDPGLMSEIAELEGSDRRCDEILTQETYEIEEENFGLF